MLTTPLVPAALAFEKRTGLPEGTLITALYLDEEMTRHTEDLERGAIGQEKWSIEAGRRLGVPHENLMGRPFADLRPETTVTAAAEAARHDTGRHRTARHRTARDGTGMRLHRAGTTSPALTCYRSVIRTMVVSSGRIGRFEVEAASP